MFPILNNIIDLLPFVQECPELKIVTNEEFGIITLTYLHTSSEFFINPLQRECRSIVFELDTGRLLSRSFHKFFNEGERWLQFPDLYKEDNPELNLNLIHEIRDKLDGSMVYPVLTKKGLKLCTKAGITNVSTQAEALLTSSLKDKLTLLLERGLTPIFEFTSPFNQIVLKYETEELTLLAVRETVTGNYRDTELATFGKYLEVSIPKEYKNISLSDVKHWIDKEGIILIYPNGERLKVKADEYVLKHRVITNLLKEKHVIDLVITNGVDDILPLLNKEDKDKLLSYTQTLNENITNLSVKLTNILNEYKHLSRKEIASLLSKLNKENVLNKQEVFIFWSIYKGNDGIESIKSTLGKYLSSSTKIEEWRWLIGTQWVPTLLNEETDSQKELVDL